MPLLTAQIVSDAASIRVADDGGEGVCEMAVEHEAAAIRDARGIVGADVYAELLTTDYTTADPDAVDEAEAERGAVYALYVSAVARLAVVRVGPLALTARITNAGGAQVQVGEGDRQARLMTMRDAQTALDTYRRSAEADLLTVAEAIAGVSETDDIDALTPLYIC